MKRIPLVYYRLAIHPMTVHNPYSNRCTRKPISSSTRMSLTIASTLRLNLTSHLGFAPQGPSVARPLQYGRPTGTIGLRTTRTGSSLSTTDWAGAIVQSTEILEVALAMKQKGAPVQST
jgi:hypothetical protein